MGRERPKSKTVTIAGAPHKHVGRNPTKAKGMHAGRSD